MILFETLGYDWDEIGDLKAEGAFHELPLACFAMSSRPEVTSLRLRRVRT